MENRAKNARLDTAMVLAEAFFADHLKCSICLDVFSGPCLMVPCSHEFCERCIGAYLHQTKAASCPLCRGKIKMVVNSSKVTTGLVDAYRAQFPPAAAVEGEVPAPALLVKKNVSLRKGHRQLFGDASSESSSSSSSEGEEESGSGSDSEDSEDSEDQQEVARQQAVASNAVNTFMQLTGATESDARRTIAGALARGLSLDHAVEFYFAAHT